MLNAGRRYLIAPALCFPLPHRRLADGYRADLAVHPGEAPHQRMPLLRNVHDCPGKALVEGTNSQHPVDEDVFLRMGGPPQRSAQDGIGAEGDNHGTSNMRLCTTSGPG
jgi:hypothetical protein